MADRTRRRGQNAEILRHEVVNYVSTGCSTCLRPQNAHRLTQSSSRKKNFSPVDWSRKKFCSPPETRENFNHQSEQRAIQCLFPLPFSEEIFHFNIFNCLFIDDQKFPTWTLPVHQYFRSLSAWLLFHFNDKTLMVSLPRADKVLIHRRNSLRSSHNRCSVMKWGKTIHHCIDQSFVRKVLISSFLQGRRYWQWRACYIMESAACRSCG